MLESSNPYNLQQQDDNDLWTELKRKEVDYEKRRNKRVQYYESVRHAQTVQIDEIPLPSAAAEKPATTPAVPRIQMPIPPPSILVPLAPPPGILKKNAPEPVEEEKYEKEPPGCPAGPPPNLKKMRELDSDYEDELSAPKKKSKLRFSDETDKKSTEADDEKLKPNSVQQKMLALSGQNIDDFMKEMENVQKKKEAERLAEEGKEKASSDADSTKDSDSDDSDDSNDDTDERSNGLSSIPLPSVAATIIPNPAPPISLPPIPSSAPPINLQPPPPIGMPPGMMFRPPPPLRPGMPGIRMPPGPPPGHRPRMAIRMPPPPPRHMHHHPKGHHGPGVGLNVVSAGPQLTSKDPKSATITAKPQIR
jgi:WW domain-binding protein 11